MEDLAANNVDVLTLGQYLQLPKKHLSVQRFVHPDEFAELREIGYACNQAELGGFFPVAGTDCVHQGPQAKQADSPEKHF